MHMPGRSCSGATGYRGPQDRLERLREMAGEPRYIEYNWMHPDVGLVVTAHILRKVLHL